jgi:rubrerythrin
MTFEHLEEKEAVKKAALIEINGFKFYSLLAEKTTDEKVQKLFQMLAADEGKHLKIIEGHYYPEAGFYDEITDEEIEIEEYVKKLGVPDIFTKKIDIEKLVKAIDEPKKALLIALDTERHAIEFFEDMAKHATTEDGKKQCAELAEEERVHHRHIAELLEEYR